MRAISIKRRLSIPLLCILPPIAYLSFDDPVHARVAGLSVACLLLWILEIIPLFVTTFILWVGITILLGPLDPKYQLPAVLESAASPILPLFLGGFILGVAGEKYGIDRYISNYLIQLSGGRRRLLLLNLMAGTALLSMWMSNIAAVAMMLAALSVLLRSLSLDDPFRKALLLGVALAGDFGGMGTPIGTGPNAIALASIQSIQSITFLNWMLFAIPLTVLMLLVAYVILILQFSVSGTFPLIPGHAALKPRGNTVVALFTLAVLAWLSEPLHGMSAPAIALIVSALLFATRLLDTSDLARIDWSTLILIAGGLTLGELLDRSGFAKYIVTAALPANVSQTALYFMMITFAAVLSALASNTAAAALIIPLGMSIAPSVDMALLIALGTSMGVPFFISTPPNAMVYGMGGLRSWDLFLPGSILTLIGCALLALTGPTALDWLLLGG